MTNKIDKKQAHALLMQYKSHYLWNKNFKKWTDEDFTNLLNGIDPFSKLKPLGNKVSMQPVQMTAPNGEVKDFKSIAEAARKTGIKASNIYAVVSGRFSKTSNHKFIKLP